MSIVSLSAPAAVAESFSDLPMRQATRAALVAMNIVDPTPIQSQALPAMLEGRDLIGQARTGSGKTLAFAIPAVERIDPKIRAVQVLVLTPTRELAVQVGGVFDQLVAGQGIRSALIYGGRAYGPQREALQRGAQIVVGTPGRVDDLMNQGALRLADVRFLVLDEADEMLDRGFGPQVRKIIERMPRDRQTALFSATVPDWVHETAARYLIDPIHVSVDPNPDENMPIEHIAYDVPDGQKFAVLRALLDKRGSGQVIVFGRTKHGVKKLARHLEIAGYPVAALQGNLSQNARDKVMEDYRAGHVQILLATNVAARGLDISTVEQVINYELPESSELLTHRVGRTGRMGRAGQAVTLLAGEDLAKWRQIERGLSVRVPRRYWDGPLPAGPSVTMPVQVQRSSRPVMSRPARPIRPEARPRPESRPRIEARPQLDLERSDRGEVIRPVWPPLPPVVEEMISGRKVMLKEAKVSARTAERRATIEANSESTALQRQPDRGQPSDSLSRPRQTNSPFRDGAPRSRSASPSRVTHEVACSACGGPAIVRFQPDPSRPVYCDSCFEALRGEGATRQQPRRNAYSQPNRRLQES